MNTNSIQHTNEIRVIIRAFASAWMKYSKLKSGPDFAIWQAEETFSELLALLTETDETKPRGKVLAIKLLRANCSVKATITFICNNEQFVQCFEPEQIYGNTAIELPLGSGTKISLKEAKDICDAFENAIQPEVFKQRSL